MTSSTTMTRQAGRLSASQVAQAFRHAIVPPQVRLRVRAAADGCFEADIPVATAVYAGIDPRNSPERLREAIAHLEPWLTRGAGTPVAIRSVVTLRGRQTVRVTVGPPQAPCQMCGGHREVVAGHDCPRCGGSGTEPGQAGR